MGYIIYDNCFRALLLYFSLDVRSNSSFFFFFFCEYRLNQQQPQWDFMIERSPDELPVYMS